MGKLTVDLDVMCDHALTFDQYMVLYHIHTGEFEVTENQWKVFNPEAFEARFCALKKPGILPVLLSLKHRKFIEFRSDFTFRVVNKNLFNRKNSRGKKDADILSFRNSLKIDSDKNQKKASILSSRTGLEKWTSEGFKSACENFEKMRRDIGHPLNEKSAERLVPRLIRLAGDSEVIATLILNQSTECGWRGIFKLHESQNHVQKQDRKRNIDEWYGDTIQQPIKKA